MRCDEYFFKKMFQKGMQFPTEPAILKRAYIFQMEFNEYEKKFPQQIRFSEICLPEYVMYASGIFYIRRLFFFKSGKCPIFVHVLCSDA